MGGTQVGYPPSGYPPQSGYPHPGLTGVPKVGYRPGQGTPHPGLTGVPEVGYCPGQGTPHPGLMGVPEVGYPLVGEPPSRVPPTWTWLGYPPPHLDLAPVPPPYRCGQTDVMDGWMDRHVSKHYLPVVLRTRSEINVLRGFTNEKSARRLGGIRF